MLEVPNTDRRTARRAATRAEILDAAWDLAREQGLLGLNLRELAGRVGMRAPSLYSYFDSKEAIYDAMFQQGAQAILDEIRFDVDVNDVRGSLRKRAREMFDVTVSDPTRAQLLFQRTIPGFEPSPEAYAPAVELLRRTTEGFAALGITDPDAIDMWTALLSGLFNQQLANDPGGDRWGRLVDRAVDMYCDHFEILPSL